MEAPTGASSQGVSVSHVLFSHALFPEEFGDGCLSAPSHTILARGKGLGEFRRH